jgi:hypothetical protein
MGAIRAAVEWAVKLAERETSLSCSSIAIIKNAWIFAHMSVFLWTRAYVRTVQYRTILIFINHISGFRREVDDIWALLQYYAAYSGNSLPTFRDNLSVPSSRSMISWTLKMGPIGCPQTSVRNYHYTPRNKDFLTFGVGTDRLSRNVCKDLPLYAA